MGNNWESTTLSSWSVYTRNQKLTTKAWMKHPMAQQSWDRVARFLQVGWSNSNEATSSSFSWACFSVGTPLVSSWRLRWQLNKFLTCHFVLRSFRCHLISGANHCRLNNSFVFVLELYLNESQQTIIVWPVSRKILYINMRSLFRNFAMTTPQIPLMFTSHHAL